MGRPHTITVTSQVGIPDINKKKDEHRTGYHIQLRPGAADKHISILTERKFKKSYLLKGAIMKILNMLVVHSP
jgi:hypothetical protein